ncbi:hypothetical protein D0Y65_022143, partial [Glycine soja]
ACILSRHGLSGIPQTSDCANTLTSINATNPKEFQTQLINQDAPQINPSEVKASEPEAIENPKNPGDPPTSQNTTTGSACSIQSAHINDDATMTDVTPSKDPDPTIWWDVSKDGSYKALQHLTSSSAVFRDSTGSWCFGFALNLGNLSCGSLDSAKPCSHWFIVVLWSVITALKLAKEKGVSQLWIETDCTPVMDCILNKRVQKGVPFAPLVESILELMTNFDGSSLPLLS